MASPAPVTAIMRFRVHPGRMGDLRTRSAEVAGLIEEEPGTLGCGYSLGDDEIGPNG